MSVSDRAVEAAARSLAARESSCFDEVHWWESLDQLTRDAAPDEYPAWAYEFMEKYREQARVALRFAAPIIQSDALRAAASCMRDEEDARWLESWAAELDEA